MSNEIQWREDRAWRDGLPAKPKVKRKFCFSLRSFSFCIVKETGWYRPKGSYWAVGPQTDVTWVFGRSRFIKRLLKDKNDH